MLISERAEELFVAAQAVEVSSRDEFLLEACGTNARLRQEVDSLLTAANESEGFFDDLAERFGIAALSDEDNALPGQQQVGAWRLLRLIGRGGMGAVYLAERADKHFDQQAALKTLPTGISSDQSKARFLAERQILARLEHENIARLLDGGVSDDGTPYFVMDYVDGMPIDDYSDEKKLTIEQRLQLFLRACDAVQYAHRNLVVHRDIKTANVLVESNGRVRLLDFGIAKMLATSAGSPDLTRHAMRPMTPTYASPEMIRGKAVDVTTDVYSLGVLLYVMLVGRVPLKYYGLSAIEIENTVTNIIPLAASKTLDTQSEGEDVSIDEIAKRRGSDVKRLRALLRGDLDTIVAKALAKDGSDRYASVDQLAQDIRNHLAGLPVVARPPSIAYQLRKFVGRHKLGVGFAAATSLMLVVITGLAIFNAVTTERQSLLIAAERDRAQEITAFLVSVFHSTDPDESAGDMTALQVLNQGRQRIVSELADQPETQVELFKAMSEVYNGLRMNDESEEILYQELALRESLSGVNSAEYADVLLRLAQITDVGGDYDASLSYSRQALSISTSLSDRQLQAGSHNRVGRIVHLQGDLAAAESHYRKSLALYTELYGLENENAVKSMEHLANALNHQGKYSEALAMFRQVLAARERILGEDHSEIGPALLGIGSVLTNMDRLDEASEVYERAYAHNNKALGPDNRRNLYVINGLGKVARAMGDYELAAERFEEAGRLVHKYFGEHGNLGITKSYEATAYNLNKQFELAVPIFRESIAILENKIPDNPLLGETRWRLGRALLETGRPQEAEAFVTSGFEIAKAKQGMEHASTQGAIATAVDLYTALGRPDELQRFRDMLAEQ